MKKGEGLAAKDIGGTSDPFAYIGVIPANVAVRGLLSKRVQIIKRVSSVLVSVRCIIAHKQSPNSGRAIRPSMSLLRWRF